jgi:hypothetical protein
MAEPKRPGRPAIAPGTEPARVHVSLAPRDFDRAERLAKQRDVSVPELLRQGLARVLDENGGQ